MVTSTELNSKLYIDRNITYSELSAILEYLSKKRKLVTKVSSN